MYLFGRQKEDMLSLSLDLMHYRFMRLASVRKVSSLLLIRDSANQSAHTLDPIHFDRGPGEAALCEEVR